MTRLFGALALAAAIAAAGAARAQNYSPTGACPTHQWNDAYGSATVAADCTQPALGDISGTAASSQLPAATTGAQGAVKIGAGLQVLSGTVSAAPPQAGYFSFSSATLVQFCPENGALAQVAGAVLTIPAACVTAANTGVQVFSTGSTSSTANLANSTLYYVGALNNSGSLAIAFFPASAYGHMPDTTAGNLGVEVLSSSGSPLTGYTLVGMVYTNSSGQFQGQAVGTRSWFNRLIIRSSQVSVGNVSTGAGSLTQLGTATLTLMKWSTEAASTNVLGSVLENNASGTGTVGLGQSGACSSVYGPAMSITGNNSSIYAPLSLTDYSTFANTEGDVVLPLCGNSGSSSYTLTINGAVINFTTHG